MSEAHLHLLLTHVPVITIVLGTVLLGYAWLRRRPEAMQIAMWAFVLSALVAVVVYLTGEGAEEIVEGMVGVSEAIIEEHEEAAVFALGGALLLGAVSAVGLWLSRREVPRWFGGATLLVALAVTGIMAWTANLGGQISHPEIRSATEVVSGETLHEDHDD